MKTLEARLNGFELSINGTKCKERFSITSEYPQTNLASMLFSNLGLMYLASPYLPQTIVANFWVAPEMQELITAMYASENHRAPRFKTSQYPTVYDVSETSSDRVAIAYSGGKDSMWNLWRAQEKYGLDSTLAVHIGGLNRANGPRELEYTKRQQEYLGFNLQIVKLANSSSIAGYKVMRARDMFLAGLAIPYALEFGASKILIEGFAETGEQEPFSGKEKNMIYFNEILKRLKIPAQIDWKNRKEMDVVKDLVINRPDWLEYVCNCFSAPCYQPPLRRSWEKHAPSLKLYDSQCGSCVKCRMTNLGRVLYDPQVQTAAREDIEYFLKNTAKWFKTKLPLIKDMIEGSFLRDLNKALKKYGLPKM